MLLVKPDWVQRNMNRTEATKCEKARKCEKDNVCLHEGSIANPELNLVSLVYSLSVLPLPAADRFLMRGTTSFVSDKKAPVI